MNPCETRPQPAPISEEGGWGLYEETEETPDFQRGCKFGYYLFHDCGLEKVGVAQREHYHNFSSPCAWCQCPVPEGLQGLFVMLTGDMET